MARARTLSFALAAIGLIAVATPASAAENVKEVKTRVKIKGTSTLSSTPPEARFAVSGVVRSRKHACERFRRVKLKLIETNHGTDPGHPDHAGPVRLRFVLLTDQVAGEVSTYRVRADRSFPAPGPQMRS